MNKYEKAIDHIIASWKEREKSGNYPYITNKPVTIKISRTMTADGREPEDFDAST